MDHAADDARHLTAAEQGRAIAAGRLDPVALAEAYLEAIESHPAGSLAYARTTRARALSEAAAARDRAQTGNRLGPLDGVPVSWKDLVDSAGTATEAGTRLMAGRVPEADGEVLARATATGAVCLGKTHLSEIAFSGLGFNPMTATPPNRHDARLAPGGSSSGAAASLAFGLAALAIGSDTGGSVRIPAAWNDLVGLKTTFGLIPNTGTVALAPSLDTIGPLARSVEDAALGLGLLTGTSAPALPTPAPQTASEGAPLRLYVPEDVVLDALDPGIAAAFEDALDRLARAGAQIARGPMPLFSRTVETAATQSWIVNAEAWAVWGAAMDASPDTLYPRIEDRVRTGTTVPPERLATARETFATLGRETAAFIAEHGMLAMPAVPNRAPPIARLAADPDYYVEQNLLALRNTRLANLLALSALTLPTGHPMAGLMLMAGPFEEAALLIAGAQAEQALRA
ncbi:MAG: amidase family protein [Pseudomonadota bacterium]